MTLIVEDGTGVTNADAYVSVSEADSYFSARNNSVWSSKTTAEKEAAILYATIYLDANFLWIGHLKSYEQSLGWPRAWAYDCENRLISQDSVPLKVKHATCELALIATSRSLSPPLVHGGEVKRQKVSSLEVEYFERAKKSTTYPLIEQILNGYYQNHQQSIELVR